MADCVHLLEAIHKYPKQDCAERAAFLDSYQAVKGV